MSILDAENPEYPKGPKTHGMCSGAHPHDGDILSIAPKGMYIVLHPLQEHPLVSQAQVEAPLGLPNAGGKEAQRPQAVVEGDGHNVSRSVSNKTRHIPLRAFAEVEAPAMNTDDDRHLRIGAAVRGWAEDIGIQTVFRHYPALGLIHAARKRRTYRPVPSRIERPSAWRY